MQQRIRLISLTVDAAGQIHSMRIEETGGSSTTFTFTDQHEDVPTTGADFTLTPPDGVPIVDGTPPI